MTGARQVQLEELVGQTRAVAVLRSAIQRDRVSHAYLFCGPESVGKSAAALLFAQALNCHGARPRGTISACGECRSCDLIARGNHPDVRLITIGPDAEGKQRTEISIDQIRQNPSKPRQSPPPLIQDAHLKPVLARYKVYVIDPAERMTQAAGNALLKILEEPPPHVVLVLVTSEASALLPTVVSRCQQVVFQLAGTDAVEQHLLALSVEPAVAASLARLSGGRVGWAVRASQRPGVLSARKVLLDLCAGLAARGLSAGLRAAEEIKLQALALARERTESQGDADEETEAPAPAAWSGSDRAVRTELPWCLDVMASWYRDILAAAQGSTLLNKDYQAALCERSASGRSLPAERAIESILQAKRAIQRNANIDLALESLAIGLVGAGD